MLKEKPAEQIVLKFTNYIVKGISDLTNWGGMAGCIEMKQFSLPEITEKALLENINDNGFGVEKINGAICDIYANYEGTLVYLETITVGSVTEDTHDTYNSGFMLEGD